MKNIQCLGGWQERDELDKSQMFDVKAVKQTSKLARNAKGAGLFIIDIDEGEVVWLDVSDHEARKATNVHSAFGLFDMIAEKYTKGDQMTLKELAELAVRTNGGEITDNPEDADVLFMLNDYQEKKEKQRVVTAKNQDIWIGEFLSPQKKQADGLLSACDAVSTTDSDMTNVAR